MDTDPFWLIMAILVAVAAIALAVLVIFVDIEGTIDILNSIKDIVLESG